MTISPNTGSPDAPHDRPPGHNPAGWIEHWAAFDGDSPALHYPGAESSYSDFNLHIQKLAQVFDSHGVSPGDRIGILLENRPAYLEAVIAGARLGAITLPINSRLAPAELRFIIEDARPLLVLADSRSLEKLQAVCAKRLESNPASQAIDIIEVPDDPGEWADFLHEVAPLATIAEVQPDDPMMLMYTSGTTGKPKGAVLPYRKTLYNCLNARGCFGLTRRDRCLVVAPLFHSLGLQILSLPALYSGACIVLEERFDALASLRRIEQKGITYMGGVPTHFDRIGAQLKENGPGAFDLGSLRFMFGAGAAVGTETIRQFSEFGIVLKQGYGQTETSLLCCLEEADALRKAGTVGRPLEHLELRVIEPESLGLPVWEWRDVEAVDLCSDPAAVGEIVVRGPVTMLGYWERPEETAKTLREGWVLTGDLATIDLEGFVKLVGRSREMFISGGENVYPAEIEASYSRHPEILEIAVRGVPDDRWGEVGAAFVVLEPGCEWDAAGLAEWGREELARFKIPSSFKRVDALPKTASGKVQKHLLKD